MREIKKAGTECIELIQHLTHAIWPEAYKHILTPAQLEYMLELIYSDEALIHEIESEHHQFIIAYEENIANGFAAYSPKHASPATYRLHKLYVLPNQQGKGTGKFLLNHVIDDAKMKNASILELNVNRYNKAVQFYTKQGFTIIAEEDIDIGHGYFMNDYVMQKLI